MKYVINNNNVKIIMNENNVWKENKKIIIMNKIIIMK